ncbi:DUF4174 domain-containing protein [Pelagicoccus sp. SDUM812005]|uniref:DUF4174 domain-containing protein n=1 Tax=Pelagicoccus sp. SDUM812005 TaxID=3041257 RepID=UPI00280DB3D9|nr:DUF4174 domain-containing protein [Pelagicoccus sp. SDUM812005]MDQ8182702.1 DUF4174 domain-containing protein [Pelagicoccus sp. SDUM812005]
MVRLGMFLLAVLLQGQLLGEAEAERSLESVRWEHRVLAYVVSSEAERIELEQALVRGAEALEDRDLLLVSLGEIELEWDRSFRMSAEEKSRWRERWQIEEGVSQFVLVGKDGGTKAFQKGELQLELLFELIDRMPMRAAELRDREGRTEK